MKIQLSPVPIVKDAITVWNEASSNVDVTMALDKITYKENSIDQMFAFHVLDHFFPAEALAAVRNWLKCIRPGGELYVVVDDFEHVCRAYVGGELKVDEINGRFAHPTYFDRYNLADLFLAAGVAEGDLRMWFADVTDLFPKQPYELIMAVTKR